MDSVGICDMIWSTKAQVDMYETNKCILAPPLGVEHYLPSLLHHLDYKM